MKRNALFEKSLNCLVLSLLIIFFTVCREKTEEELILKFMEEIGRCAEEKNIEGIMVHLAEDYSDFEGRNRWQTKEMVNDYFRQYQGIVVHLLSSRIEKLNIPQAIVESEVALSSGAATVFRKLVRFSTENYRLTINLDKCSGQWKIQHAEWRYITIDELYPESVSILKKLFPGVWD